VTVWWSSAVRVAVGANPHVVVQTPEFGSLEDFLELVTLERRIKEALAGIETHGSCPWAWKYP
jgi:hypothetical protein